MKKFLAAASAVTLMALAAPAFAQEGVEGSISYASVGIEDVDLGAVRVNLSWRSSNFIGVEGEFGFGISDDDVAPGVTAELNTLYGAYVTATADVSENVALFGRVGYAGGEVEAGAFSADDSGLAYGVGAKFFLDGRNGVRLDYTKLDFDDGDADIWAIGYVRRF